MYEWLKVVNPGCRYSLVAYDPDHQDRNLDPVDLTDFILETFEGHDLDEVVEFLRTSRVAREYVWMVSFDGVCALQVDVYEPEYDFALCDLFDFEIAGKIKPVLDED